MSGEKQSQNLGEREHRHEAGADAAEHLWRGLLLHQGLGGHDDEADAEAHGEGGSDSSRGRAEDAQQCRAGSARDESLQNNGLF